MNYLIIAQFMVAAIFSSVALTHAFVWAKETEFKLHILFSLVVLAAGANAVSEAWFYQASSIESFTQAYRWYVNFSGLWLLALIWFIMYYSGLIRVKRWPAIVLTISVLLSILDNNFSSYGHVYTEVTGLREIALPWGEVIVLGVGIMNPWLFIAEFTQAGLLLLIWYACFFMWRKQEKRSAILMGGALSLFLIIFSLHTALVDSGVINSPYLTSYGFLLVVIAMSFDLAGQIIARFKLSQALVANEKRWQTLLNNVHLLVVSVDKDGVIDYVNPFYQHSSGYTDVELTGESFLCIIPENLRHNYAQGFDSVIQGNIQPHSNAQMLIQSGQVLTIFWSNVLLRDMEGGISGLLSVGTDITELQKTKEERDQALKNIQQVLAEVESLKNQYRDQVVYLRKEVDANVNSDEFIGESDVLKYILHKINQVAEHDTAVLIEGETGVGKELVARSVHNQSPRHHQPLIKVNCAALPENLIESELFGHEKGAFTGAEKLRKGRFEMANGGTLFLDEVGELPLALQSKLLRVLQEGELERIGSSETLKVDVRIIAATNRELGQEVKQGRFREDLYYRLNVFPITVAPLRQRLDDIPLLANAFIQKYSRAQGKKIDGIPQAVMNELKHYRWPGNIRELQNILERAVIVTANNQTLKLAERLTMIEEDKATVGEELYQGTLETIERNYIIRILTLTNWRIDGEQGAAELLGLNPSTLRSRMRKWSIKRSQKSK
ncbi:MAG: PAS domain S-box protein [Methyloprofundus sp.]|nr:PAS domain S-box protein [Methyloprofundus sp.]